MICCRDFVRFTPDLVPYSNFEKSVHLGNPSPMSKKQIDLIRSTHTNPNNFIVTLLLHCSSLRFLQRPKFPPFSKFLLNFNVGFCKIEFLSKSVFLLLIYKCFSNIPWLSWNRKCVLDIKKEPAKHSNGANLSSFVYDVLNCKITSSPLNSFF